VSSEAQHRETGMVPSGLLVGSLTMRLLYIGTSISYTIARPYANIT